MHTPRSHPAQRLTALLLGLALLACQPDPEPVHTPDPPQSPQTLPELDPLLSAATHGGAHGLPPTPPSSPTLFELAAALPLEPAFTSDAERQALHHFERRRYTAAYEAFSALPPTPDTRALAALALFYDRRYAEAIPALEALITDHPRLAAYFTYFTAESLRRVGADARADALLAHVPPHDPNIARATLTRVEALLDLHRHDDALALLDNAPISPELLELQRDLRTERGEIGHALSHAISLVLHFPNSREARDLLSDLFTPTPDLPRNTDGMSSLRRGERLYRRHQYRRATRELKRASRQLEHRPDDRCEALLLLARAYEHRDLLAPALDTFQSAIDTCAATPAHPLILFTAGRFFFHTQRHDDALTTLATLHATAPEASVNDDAWLIEARIHRDRDDEAQAQHALSQAISHGDDQREAAAFDLVWSLFHQDQLQEAREIAAQHAHLEPAHADAQGRLPYWHARLSQQLGETQNAIQGYLDVLHAWPLTWYGVLAASRLESLIGQSALLYHLEHHPPPALSSALLRPSPLPEGQLEAAAVLLRLGLDSAAERHLAHHLSPADTGWLLARLYTTLGDTRRAYRHARRQQHTLTHRIPTPSTLPLYHLAFPRPFDAEVEKTQEIAPVDPSLIYAVMRRESSFRIQARSSANARGLMQLMLPTAQAMYDDLEREPPTLTRDDLHEPALNILLGTRYLHRQLQRYGHPALAAAGYNAGGPSVRRWLAARGHLPLDVFVESIPYTQTRRYVRAVIGYYAAYHILETGQPLRLALKLL